MKTFFFLALSILLLIPAVSISGTTYVRPYVRSDGTFVQAHYRTTPNNSTYDNWSTKGNINPYTGKPGYIDPYDSNSRGTSIYNTRYPSFYNNDND